MIHAGDTLENPITGERLTFVKTSRETGGECVVVDVTVAPNGFVAAAHMHPFQTERFEILSGTIRFKLGRNEIEARRGDVVTVEPATPHKFWNASDEEARFVMEITPALSFERLIETMFSLAADGKTNKKGFPNPLQLAVIARAHFDHVRLPFPPVFLQRAGLALAAPVGWMIGYRPAYA